MIPLTGKAQILSTKYIQWPRHYSELLNRHAQQDLNTFQAWPSSLDHTCFQGPEAKNNSGASKTGHQPGPGVAAGPLLSSANSTGRSYITLQSYKKKPTTGFFLCQSTSVLGLLIFFAPGHQSKSRNSETSRFYGVLFLKTTVDRNKTQEMIQETLLLISAPLQRH